MNTKIQENPFLPIPGKVKRIKDIAHEIKLLQIELIDGAVEAFNCCKPGQFAFLSAFGVGEAPFGIANIPNGNNCFEFAINRLGSVTTSLHQLSEGDYLGIRGPLGNYFPMEEFINKDLIILGGGVGGAPLRPVIQTILKNRESYGSLIILWAARHPSLLIFTDEYENWRSAENTELHLTVDEPDSEWDHGIGLITDLLERVNPCPDNSISITCGPPIMIHYVNKMLIEKMGFKPEQNFVTLEARMHCGIGKCGRCNMGEKFICIDGPVFSMDQVDKLLENII